MHVTKWREYLFVEFEDIGEIQEPDSDNELENTGGTKIVEGTIDVVVSANVCCGYTTCKTKIYLINNKIGECKKCGSIMKLTKCQDFIC